MINTFMRLSREEEKKIATIYEKMLHEDMDAGDVVGGEPTSGGELVNSDDYATGDNRIPYLIGRVMTRNGKIKKRKKKRAPAP